MPDPQSPRFGELLRRLLITKGYGQANVLDDYFPSIDMLADKPEMLKLRSEQGFMIGGRGIGAVSAVGRLWCMNKKPAHLAVVDQIVIGLTAGMVMSLDMTTIGLPADGAGGNSLSEVTDSRYGFGIPGTTPNSAVTAANDTSGGAQGAPIWEGSAGSTLVMRGRWVLRPGYALLLSSGTTGVGSNFTASFWGYVRGTEESELSG